MSDAGRRAAQKRSWIKPALIVSLALNLLFAGLIAGAIWKRHHGKWRPRHVVLEMSIQQMIAELPAERRKPGEKALAVLHSQFPQAWDKIRDQRKDAVAALTADPYDETRFAEALASVRKTYADSRQTRHDAVIEFVRDLSVAERRHFVEVYKSNRRGPWERKKKKKPE